MLEQTLQSAVTALEQNNFQLAESLARKVLSWDKSNAYALYICGVVSYQKGSLKDAVQFLKRSAKFAPDNVGVLNALGGSYQSQGKFKDAIQCFRKCIKLDPTFASAYNNLGVIYKIQERLNDAVNAYKKAVSLNPKFGDALNNLGLLLQDLGDLKGAQDCFLQAVSSGQCRSLAYSNYLLSLNYDSSLSPQVIYEEHKNWGSKFKENRKAVSKSSLSKNIKKIAYLSPDLRSHSVAYFLKSVLESHNKSAYSVICYFNSSKSDDTTNELKKHVDVWRDVEDYNNQELYEVIQKDCVDVLIDLSGHTGKNRLDLFSLKPAPLQVTWIGYPNTTGLDTVDLRLTDELADPEGMDRFYSEKLIRLPHGFLCYKGNQRVESNKELPFTRNGYITFGSFNSLTKLTEEVFKVWSDILHGVENSKLLLKSGHIKSQDVKQMLQDRFKSYGISKERIILKGPLKEEYDHLKLYDQVDIGLDPFPYNGTTTTCEALWMGVPVITRTMGTHASRVGVSLLSRIKLEDLVASNNLDYIKLARELASNIDRISELRRSLRDTMESSDLCNGPKFTRSLEIALEKEWIELVLGE